MEIGDRYGGTVAGNCTIRAHRIKVITVLAEARYLAPVGMVAGCQVFVGCRYTNGELRTLVDSGREP